MIPKAHLVALLGEEQVSFETELLDAYARDMSFVPGMRPGCVVKPRSSDQINALVAQARASGTPLVPVSSGPPHFLGDTVPSLGGAVMVDLRAMKKVLHIDRKNRVAMFEPGVTFAELSQAVAQKGLRLNMPLLPRKEKSVVGSLLNREPVLMPKYHWDIADPLACTEIVFGTGELFRTGAAAGSGSIEAQWSAGGSQKEAAGPSAASWYRIIQGAQGTMGIVTWVSARCELQPTRQAPFFISATTLDPILETVHWLVRLRLVNECFIFNNSTLALAMDQEAGPGHQRIKADIPPWILFFNIAAYEFLPDERVDGQIADMVELTQRLGVEAVSSCGDINARQLLDAVQNPSPEPYWKLRHSGGCQDIFFLTELSRLPGMMAAMKTVADAHGHPRDNLGVYIQPIVQGVNCHCEFNLFYDPGDQYQVQRTRALTDAAIKHLANQGAFFSRPFGESARYLINRDAETVTILKKVKNIVDPHNIMNPGKLCF